MHYHAIFDWLVNNNLWKATVAFWVTLFLGVMLGAAMRPWRAWKHHREVQEKIADRLDTSTPGGLSDLVKALRAVLDELDEGSAPDDNGSDPDVDGDSRHDRTHGDRAIPGLPHTIEGHGGSSAAHR